MMTTIMQHVCSYKSLCQCSQSCCLGRCPPGAHGEQRLGCQGDVELRQTENTRPNTLCCGGALTAAPPACSCRSSCRWFRRR